MVAYKLIDDLKPHLKEAKEIWIAVALLKDEALKKLFEAVPSTTKQNYLVGTDLPTEPVALRTLMGLQSNSINAALFKTSKTFHPKVYIIKKETEFIGFVGSSNLTEGGLSENIEVNIFTNDQEACRSLFDWFNRLYATAFPLTEENIKIYETRFTEVKEAEKSIKKARVPLKFKKPEASDNPLDTVDFSDRYFKKEHHMAFRPELSRRRTPDANKERRKVYDRFYELHEDIFPKFQAHGLSDLDHHKVKRFIVSHYEHVDGFTSQQLDHMWLSYGKKKEVIQEYQKLFSTGSKRDWNSERDEQSFINHARLQIIISMNEIGIWLFFGKRNGGSKFDRDHFKHEMKNSNYRDRFFKLFRRLPEQYRISLADNEWYNVDHFPNAESLHDYCKKDDLKNHFIIGGNYKIEDEGMALASLPATVLTEFKRMFPLYDMMRDKKLG